MYRIIFPLLLSMLALFPALCRAASPSPDKIVAKADEVRNPQLDYTVDVAVTSLKPDGAKRSARYEVLVKGKEKTVVKTMAPESDRGTTLLRVDRDLWSFLPNLSQPVRISMHQRLIGEVANGDIARANFAGDYDARLLRQESGDYVLALTAKSEDVTYGRVVYWVHEGDFHPVKAEFYAISGRLLKRCSYERYRMLAGRLRPTRLVMTDALVAGQKSILEYDKLNVAPLPEKYFTKDYLKRFKY